ncbi:MAG: S41 family peptidase, partial [Blastocatellia bacterium]|nr:S41 family peptidase [Blastocatellia bacterium]
QRLSKSERLSIIDHALVLLDMSYVHLPLKRAMHAVDPIQRLKLMKFSLSEMDERKMPSEMIFHQRLLEIFTSARDIHTMYLLPSPFNKMVAYLPFLIEGYFKNRKRKFMVSRVVDIYFEPFRHESAERFYLEPGVEALYWNGIPIERAIEINGEKQAGSNLEARFARGLDNLTIRPLKTSLPPDERWVTLTYRAKNGKEYELKQEWMVFNPDDVSSKERPKDLAKEYLCIYKRAVDHKKKEINSVITMLYAGRQDEDISDFFRETIKTTMNDVLHAERIKLYEKEFGYLRIFTFEASPARLVREIRRILTSGSFPQEGVILDMRSNGGGLIEAGERLLQLFTPRRIKPELFEFINTPLNLEICRNAPKNWGMSKWAESIAESVMTNATYSSGFPITSEKACNDIGQVYYGPVVLITDALSYSTTDIFAAGFQDNEIGEILGTSGNTGAGGANVWPYDAIKFALGKKARYLFTPLPKGAEMNVAVRRSIRVGKQVGRPLEELGIVPDRRHYMTRNDLLNRNPDMIEKAARMLMGKPVYGLSVNLQQNQGLSKTIEVSTKNISRLDIYIDDRPFKTVDTVDGTIRVGKIPQGVKRTKSILLLNGYNESNTLAAMCRRFI